MGDDCDVRGGAACFVDKEEEREEDVLEGVCGEGFGEDRAGGGG